MKDALPVLGFQVSPAGEVSPREAREKLQRLLHTLEPLVGDGVLVAFSGGMDSAFLLWACSQAAERAGRGRVVALTTTSPSTPEEDRRDAEAFARDLGLPHLWRESREMELVEYVRNQGERCYHCKVELFRIAGDMVRDEGLKWVLYGYNESDRGDDRPGHRAAEEGGVLSPLADAGLSKGEIRFLMREAGLSLAEKPASPCLGSRIMTGIPITAERLSDVAVMEGILRDAGASIFRARVCRDQDGADFLRVEVAPDDFQRVLKCRTELQEAGRKRGYRWVTLDLGGYRTGGGV
jgi:uncharacterized protein